MRKARHRKTALASPAPGPRQLPQHGYEGTNRSTSAGNPAATDISLTRLCRPRNGIRPHNRPLRPDAGHLQSWTGHWQLGDRPKANPKPPSYRSTTGISKFIRRGPLSVEQAESIRPHILPARKTQDGRWGINEKFIPDPGNRQKTATLPGSESSATRMDGRTNPAATGHADSTEDGSTFTPGPIVDEIATRCR